MFILTSTIANCRNRPAAAENAANFFRSSTRAAGGKIIEKLSYNVAATLNFLLIEQLFGLSAYLAFGEDRNAIGPGRFRCHLHSFTDCVRMRTTLPLTGRCLNELGGIHRFSGYIRMRTALPQN